MTSSTDSRPLLNRAFVIATPIVEVDVGVSDLYTELLAPDADPLRVMAHAFNDAIDRLFQFYKPMPELPIAYRCGWCVTAAGDTKEAWNAAQVYTKEEVAKHTLVCDGNPLVAAIRAALAAHDNCRFVIKLHCLGTTQDGFPKHPLARGKHRIPGDLMPQEWSV